MTLEQAIEELRRSSFYIAIDAVKRSTPEHHILRIDTADGRRIVPLFVLAQTELVEPTPRYADTPGHPRLSAAGVALGTVLGAVEARAALGLAEGDREGGS